MLKELRTKYYNHKLLDALQKHKFLDKAGKNHKLKKIEKYLYHGADGNIKDKNGLTPLMLAAQEGELAIVQCLVRAGVDVNTQANNLTALYYACSNYFYSLEQENRYKEIIQLLIKSGATISNKNILYFANELQTLSQEGYTFYSSQFDWALCKGDTTYPSKEWIRERQEILHFLKHERNKNECVAFAFPFEPTPGSLSDLSMFSSFNQINNSKPSEETSKEEIRKTL